MSITDGLYSDLIWAWKSGRKPSPIHEINRYRLPSDSSYKGLSLPFYSFSLKKLNKTMPMVATTPIPRFLYVSLSLESLTLEQKTPTMMTESRLQDLAITMAGNEASTTAILYVATLRLIMAPQMSDPFTGSCFT